MNGLLKVICGVIFHSFIEADEAMQAQEKLMTEAFENWWGTHQDRIISLMDSRDLMTVRSDFLETFDRVLVPVGLLDRFKVSGVVASWWGDVVFDLKTLMARRME